MNTPTPAPYTKGEIVRGLFELTAIIILLCYLFA